MTSADDSDLQADSPSKLGVAGSPWFVVPVGVVVIAAGLALAAFRFVGSSPVEDGAEGALGSAALGTIVAAPGILALLALADRPPLLLPAAIALIPLSFLSFAGITLPLLIPSAMLFVGYGRRSACLRQFPPGTVAATTLATFALLLAAVISLFVHQDPRSYSTPTGGGSTGDVITFGESVLSLTLTAAAIAGGWFLAAPPGRRPRPDTRQARRPQA